MSLMIVTKPRLLSSLVLILVLAGIGLSQQASKDVLGQSLVTYSLAGSPIPPQAVEDTECDYVRVVTRALEERKINLVAGITEKQNARLGDNVAVALLKLYSREELVNPDNVRLYLPVIRNSFPHFRTGEKSCHRNPKVTLFLLHWLKGELEDRQLKEEVSQLIANLEIG